MTQDRNHLVIMAGGVGSRFLYINICNIYFDMLKAG